MDITYFYKLEAVLYDKHANIFFFSLIFGVFQNMTFIILQYPVLRSVETGAFFFSPFSFLFLSWEYLSTKANYFSLGCPVAVVRSAAGYEDKCLASAATRGHSHGTRLSGDQRPCGHSAGLSTRARGLSARPQLATQIGTEFQTCDAKSM